MSVVATRSLPAPSVARPVAGPGLLTRALAALVATWRTHHAMHALQSLDARGLADLGIGPGEIEAVVREGRRGAGSAGARAWADPHPALPPSWTEWR